MVLHQKVFLYFFITILIIGISSSLVMGLGVSPSRVVLKFEPNFVYDRDVCYTVQSMPILRISTSGEYADRIEFTNIQGNLLDVREVGCLHYKFTMPPTVDKPGMHYTSIFATEVPEEGSGGMFRVNVRIEHQMWLFVPYPGKYIEINRFEATNVAAGDPVPMQAEIVNKGTDVVNEVRGTIKIYDRTDKLIGTISTNTLKNLAPDEMKYLTASWDSGDYKADNYRADLDVVYDAGINNATSPFKLGGLDINLLDYTKELEVGEGFKGFFVTADSIWSQTIEKVRAIVNVHNDSANPVPITTVETVSRDIPAWGTEKLTGFIDMTNLKIGKYFLNITLFFKDPEVAEKDKQKYYEGELTIKAPPPPPEPPKKSIGQVLKGIFTTQVLLIIFGVLVLVVLAILVYLLVPKRKKDKEKEKKD
jgi:hypothetical protein